MDDIVRDFLIESGENLDRLDQELVRLESDPKSKDLLGSIFRTIHTIKGSCGFLAFAKLERVAHTGESLLSRLRDGELTLTADLTSGLLEMVDAVRQMLSDIQTTEQDGTNDYPDLIERLKILQGISAERLMAADRKQRKDDSGKDKDVVIPGPTCPAISTSAYTAGDSGFGFSPQPLGPKGMVEEPELHHTAPTMPVAPEAKATGTEEQAAAASSGGEHGSATGRGEAVTETVRIGVNLLDRLMNLVGELVLARNQLMQCSQRSSDGGLQIVSQRMNLIAAELQEQVMKTRMQPISNIWSKFPRTVRDLAHTCGKQIRLEMEGQDTELDRTIIEAIKDPLTHLVRNAVDHGIETPEARQESGKDPSGCLRLRAYHEGGQVNIEISDDGSGLDVERIRQKAIERGVITSEQAARLAEGEVFNLIFLPGFSTAEKITNVSGRGVGMDVVKTNVEKIGGMVDVTSKAGRGTTVRVKIPLTLAIIPALIVTCRNERFAIPQVGLSELVRLEADEVGKGIEMVHGVPVHRLRGRLLPLVYLSKELQLDKDGPDSERRGCAVNIAVLEADGRPFGLVVDEINDSEEIVVKPLRRQLKAVKTFAGSTIMGDGKVALILDVLGLAQRAGVVTEMREHDLGEKSSAARDLTAEKRRYLLFEGPGGSRMAMPLDTLARLEELPFTDVEKAGKQWVAQYRGNILPLINLEYALEERRRTGSQLKLRATESDAPLQVLVCNHEGHSVGLVVEQILDIIEDSAEMKYPASRPGILYSTVIAERVTELIDIPAILQTAGFGSSDSKSALAKSAEATN
ncbi:MAG TPA: chemotaxis protein CheA [Candidatus Sulfotelmatobacter sp.]